MKPTRDYVFIQLADESPTTKSGIYLTKQWDTIPPLGTVTAVGPDVTACKVGDEVIFMNYASVDTDQADIRVVKEDHILAIVTE